MSLIIRKKSAYTWEHYFDGATVPYITNVFNINNGGNNTFQLVDYRGSNLQAVPISDITLYDDTSGGIAETFSTFAELNTRLGILQYPPMKTSCGGGGGVESVSGVLLNNTDPLNPIVNGLIVDAYSQVKEIEFDGATVTDDGGGKVTVTVTGSGVTEFIELTDVPASYTGQGSKVVAVKVDETGLEFVAGGGGSTPSLAEVLAVGNTANNSISLTDGSNAIELLVGGIIVYDSAGNETIMYTDQIVSGNGTSSVSLTNNGGIQLRKTATETINIYSNNLTDTREVEMPDYDGTLTTEEWVIANVSGGAVDSVNGQTGVVVLDSDDINEGTTNLYFTDARALGAIPNATPTVKGIAKLYTSLGSNTDGAVDQNTVNSALGTKQNKEDFVQLSSPYSLSNTTSLQSLTGVDHNVVAGTYRFYCRYTLSGLAASGNCQFGLLGTAPVTVIGWTSNGAKQNTFPNTNQIAYGNVTTAIGVTGISSGTSCVMTIEGEVTFSGSGTFIPAVGFGTAPTTGVTGVGSYTSLIKIS